MTIEETLFAACLLLAGVLITTGAALVYLPAGFIVGGVLFAVWSWLILGGIDEDESSKVDVEGDDDL